MRKTISYQKAADAVGTLRSLARQPRNIGKLQDGSTLDWRQSLSQQIQEAARQHSADLGEQVSFVAQNKDVIMAALEQSAVRHARKMKMPITVAYALDGSTFNTCSSSALGENGEILGNAIWSLMLDEALPMCPREARGDSRLVTSLGNAFSEAKAAREGRRSADDLTQATINSLRSLPGTEDYIISVVRLRQGKGIIAPVDLYRVPAAAMERILSTTSRKTGVLSTSLGVTYGSENPTNESARTLLAPYMIDPDGDVLGAMLRQD